MRWNGKRSAFWRGTKTGQEMNIGIAERAVAKFAKASEALRPRIQTPNTADGALHSAAIAEVLGTAIKDIVAGEKLLGKAGFPKGHQARVNANDAAEAFAKLYGDAKTGVPVYPSSIGQLNHYGQTSGPIVHVRESGRLTMDVIAAERADNYLEYVRRSV